MSVLICANGTGKYFRLVAAELCNFGRISQSGGLVSYSAMKQITSVTYCWAVSDRAYLVAG